VPIFLALLTERTKRARIGSNIYILPLHNAPQLAQETSVLDQLSGGRLDVMVGAGHNPKEFAAFGMSPKTRPSRMEEGLTVLKRCWTERPFSFRGEYYSLQDFAVYPEPCQKPHPPLWVAATSEAAARRAGRHGAGLTGGTADPAVYRAYLEELGRHGFDTTAAGISRTWSIYTTQEDPEQIWQRYRGLYHERWDFYDRIRADMGDPPVSVGLTGHGKGDVHRGKELIGSPEQVIEVLQRACAEAPLTRIIHSFAAGIPRDEARKSLELFAEAVAPVVKSWRRPR
jgi:alkanesulfonate monooxygenase SsuD/methylene tetrahydromethanopterin reductase-like flavin-dependent oxidoreductase (luciferase family)